jgi:hypothetical protein
MKTPIVDLSFPHRWEAEILPARPLILPPRHFVYPRAAEEVERGALEVLVRPQTVGAPGPGPQGQVLVPEVGALDSETRDRTTSNPSPAISSPQPFLATCALGFRDPSTPTGLWSTPKPEELCAVSGGYAYIIDTAAPQRFTMIKYRPVLEVRPVIAAGLILFVGHHSILAWGRDGEAWQSPKLSDEGLTITAIDGLVLHGLGWEMTTDKETPFVLDLRNGQLH